MNLMNQLSKLECLLLFDKWLQALDKKRATDKCTNLFSCSIYLCKIKKTFFPFFYRESFLHLMH